MKNLLKTLSLTIFIAPLASCGASLSLTKEYKGQEVSFSDSRLTTYINLTEEETPEYLKDNKDVKYSTKNYLDISWNASKGPYTFYASKDEEFNNLTYYKELQDNKIRITNTNFYDGKYFFKVVDHAGNKVIDSFTVAQSIRVLGADITSTGFCNMRDLGGYTLKDNHKIKYGKIYRGAKLDDINDDGKKLFKDLDIKTVIDLRGANQGEVIPTSTPVDVDNFYQYSVYAYDFILNDENQSTLYKNLFTTLSDVNNYPIYFHCSAGADRTGTLAFLIEGLLGASYESVCKDYELTSFYKETRWRSAIKFVDGKLAFDESGIYQESYARFGKLINDLITTYGGSKTNLSETINNYLLAIGVSQTQIDNIKNLLTD